MHISRYFTVAAFLIICSINIYAQNLSPESNIYDFLRRMSVKYNTGYSGIMQPQQRRDVYSFLMSIKEKSYPLTQTEKEQLEFYLSEFSYEKIINDSASVDEHVNVFSGEPGGRLNVIEFVSDDFYINVNPVLEFRESNNKINTFFWNSGIYMYGYFRNDWEFSLRMRDNHYYGSQLDRTRSISRYTGYSFKKNIDTGFDFDDVDASLSYRWSAGSITVAKEHLQAGSGRESSIILSPKAPSFPYFDLTFTPTDWLKFKYIHAVLKSGLVDSSTIKYYDSGRSSFEDIPKYLVSHYLEVRPFSWMKFMLGESMVYSDHFKPVYLIPVLFFRFADHYLDDKADAGDNAQMYADMSFNISAIQAEIYGTLYIDELSIKDISEGGNLQALGYTAGIEKADPVFPNSSINVEYSRLNPFTYRNGDAAEEYTSWGYQLGHWIGSNADILSIKYYQQVTRGLSFLIDAYYCRKGQKELPKEQYTHPYPSFLYGTKRKETYASIAFEYEFINTLKAGISYTYTYITDEDKTRTPAWQVGAKNAVGVSLSYGL
jgi:hypothetical protein